jgi:hypothetical protein
VTLVRNLVREGIEAKPGGAIRPATIMFVHVAGFTGMSERLGAGLVLRCAGRDLDPRVSKRPRALPRAPMDRGNERIQDGDCHSRVGRSIGRAPRALSRVHAAPATG